MRVLQSLVISVCLGLTIHGAYAQKGVAGSHLYGQGHGRSLEAPAARLGPVLFRRVPAYRRGAGLVRGGWRAAGVSGWPQAGK